MKADNTLLQAIEEYGHSLTTKDINTTVKYIHPRVFDLVPEKSIRASLKKAYSDKKINISLQDHKLKKVLYKAMVDEQEYMIIQISFFQEVKFLKRKKIGKDGFDEFLFHRDTLVEKYGKKNVSLNEEQNYISAKSTSRLLAVKLDTSWKFLDIKQHLLDRYTSFLPDLINSELEKLFLKKKKPAKKKPVKKSKPKNGIQTQYLLGWEVRLNGDQQCENFIATQITNHTTYKLSDSALKLVYKNDKLIKAFEYNNGVSTEKVLQPDEIGKPFYEYEKNKILDLTTDSQFSPSQLGGKKPDNFKLPENNCIAPFLYLGYISDQEDDLEWLPFTVHLTCPIYLNFEKIFLDYSDPNAPVIINRDEVENAGSPFADDIDKNSIIEFDKIKFSLVEYSTFSGEGHSGIPHWIQYPDIPVCPKSGRMMKFLFQINGGVSVKNTNVEPKNESDWQYFRELNFRGDGDLFVFFEPASKIACYFIQNT